MDVYHFPADLAQIIDDAAGEIGEDPARLAERVLALSDLFVGRGDWQGDYGRSPALREAYLRYYLPVNVPKVRTPLAAWLAPDPGRFAGRTLRAIDLGSGPGSALLGLCDFVRGLPPPQRPQKLELVALDQSYENLKHAQALVGCFGARAGLAVEVQPLRLDLVADRAELFPLAAAHGRFDLVLAANVLCEIARGSAAHVERAAALVSAAAEELLAARGALVIVEPGLRETARDLHRVRDRLLRAGVLHVLAPCLHEAPCPALGADRDWCIADLAWEPPPAVRAIARRTGLRKDSLKFSYLLLARDPSRAPAPTRWRVVSDVLELKGERRVYLCADGRWIVLGQLKRGRPPAGSDFARLRRGDLVEVHGMEARGSIFRLAAHGAIRPIAPPPLAPAADGDR
ncbi:MAG: hypothetical protein HYY35_10490 [Deltaproteobacteria bacterium]|nr:hypothetical protein [Deltaproteobacteria bacterium]